MILTMNARIPPATDIGDMIGTYGSLLTSFGVANTMGSTSGVFSHPIPESVKVLLEDFNINATALEGLVNNYKDFEVVKAVHNNSNLTITIKYSEL